MIEQRAVFIFSPGANHLDHLEPVLDSIANYMSAPYQFCVLLPHLNCDFRSKHQILRRVISDVDLKRCEEWYWKEGRTDIPPFATYAQLLLPHYFSEFPAFLFMEVDQIVKGDLAPLWRHCIRENLKLGAVRSRNADGSDVAAKSFMRLHPDGRYHNMGVVFVDTIAWRDLGFFDRCVNELLLQKEQQGERLEFYAQGAMNNALHDEVTDIEYKYNVTGLGYRDDIPEDHLKSGVILHWSGPRKPWHKNGMYKRYYYPEYSFLHEARDRLFSYLKKVYIGIRSRISSIRKIISS